jgi:hypothetical protein
MRPAPSVQRPTSTRLDGLDTPYFVVEYDSSGKFVYCVDMSIFCPRCTFCSPGTCVPTDHPRSDQCPEFRADSRLFNQLFPLVILIYGSRLF